MTKSKTPETAAVELGNIQKAAFNMADNWGVGLQIAYAGVDLTSPMLYMMVAEFNRQLMQFFFPPVQAEAQNGDKPQKAKKKRAKSKQKKVNKK